MRIVGQGYHKISRKKGYKVTFAFEKSGVLLFVILYKGEFFYIAVTDLFFAVCNEMNVGIFSMGFKFTII